MNDKIKKYINFNTILNIIIGLIMYIVCRYRLFLGSNYCINFDVGKTHGYDSGWFLNNVIDFNNFNINKPFTLIKNRAYMWFLLLAHHSHIDLRQFISLFWIFASLLMFIMLYNITKNKIISIFGFIYICLNPIAFYSVQDINIYRNIIFIPSITILLSLYILFYENLKNNKYIITIIIAIFVGLSFVFMFFLTETGIVFIAIHLGFLLLFIIFSILDSIKIYAFGKRIIKVIIYKLLIVSIPIIIGFIGIMCYKFVNYRVFGVYEINMRTEGEIAKFISNVQDIESDNTNTYIWCSADEIDKAYQASETFKKNKKIYQHIKTDPISLANDKVNIHGDFLGWGITNAIELYIKDYQKTINLFKVINTELEKTLGRYSIDEIKNEIIPLFFESFWIMIKLKDLDKFVANSFNIPVDSTGTFFEFFNIKLEYEIVNCFEYVNKIIYYYSNTHMLLFYMLIINIIVSISLLFLKIVSRLFNIYTMIFDKLKIDVRYLIISLMFIIIFLLYLFCISLFNIWLYKATSNYAPLHCYYYGSMSIVFFIYSVIFSFMSYYNCFAANCGRLMKYLYKNINTIMLKVMKNEK